MKPSRFDVLFVDLVRSAAMLDAEEAETPRLPSSDAARLAKDTERRAAHIALRIALERAAGTSIRGHEFSVAEGGRPFLEGGPYFSLSHTQGAALIAVADRPVGADIEKLRPLRMSESRCGRIVAASRLLRREPSEAMSVLEAWVRLEAVAKVRGTGIGVLLTDVFRGMPTAISKIVDDGIDVRNVSVGEGYVAAMAAAELPSAIDAVTMPTNASALAVFINSANSATRRAK